MKKSLHILCTGWGVPTINQKGNPFLFDQARALAKKGIHVSFLILEFENVFYYFFKKIKNKKKYKNDEPFRLWICSCINFIPSFFFPKYSRNIQKKIIQYVVSYKIKEYIKLFGKPDIIHQHYIFHGMPHLTEFISVKFNIPYFLTEHTLSLKNSGNPYYSEKQLMKFVKNSSGRIAVSDYAKNIYEKHYGCPFSTIPNLIPNLFKTEVEKTKDIKKKFTFLNIGNLVPVKAQERLIKSFASVFKEKNIQLLIAGDGPLREPLKILIKNCNLENQVFLLGQLDRKGILMTIDESNVMIVSSDSETFNISMVEGMFRGLPVLSTRCGGPEEIINETNGLLCGKNENDLAEKMQQIFLNYNNYHPEKIINDAWAKYSEEIVADKLIALYQSALL